MGRSIFRSSTVTQVWAFSFRLLSCCMHFCEKDHLALFSRLAEPYEILISSSVYPLLISHCTYLILFLHKKKKLPPRSEMHYYFSGIIAQALPLLINAAYSEWCPAAVTKPFRARSLLFVYELLPSTHSKKSSTSFRGRFCFH